MQLYFYKSQRLKAFNTNTQLSPSRSTKSTSHERFPRLRMTKSDSEHIYLDMQNSCDSHVFYKQHLFKEPEAEFTPDVLEKSVKDRCFCEID